MGTATVAQSNPPPHGCQAMGTGGGSAMVVVVVGGTVVVGAVVVTDGRVVDVVVGALATVEQATSVAAARSNSARRDGIEGRTADMTLTFSGGRMLVRVALGARVRAG